MNEILALYLCNKHSVCYLPSDCDDILDCKHTPCEVYAKNESSVKLFYEFTKKFKLYLDEDGRIVCEEKGAWKNE